MAENQKALVGSHLLLIQNGNFLLMRKSTGVLAGRHTFVSGHTEQGESVIEAIIREAKEEVDITLNHEDLKISVVVQRVNAPYKGAVADIVDFFIFADKFSGEIKNNEPDKCDEIAFYPLNELPSTIVGFVEVALKAYQSGEKFIIHQY